MQGLGATGSQSFLLTLKCSARATTVPTSLPTLPIVQPWMPLLPDGTAFDVKVLVSSISGKYKCLHS